MSKVPTPPWTLWKFAKSSKDAWDDRSSFEILGSVDSYAELGSAFPLFLRPNTSLNHQESYFLFRAGIQPRWDDDFNGGMGLGGRVVHIDDLEERDSNRLDEQWQFVLKLVLEAQVDTFGSSEQPLRRFKGQVTGIQVDIRYSRYRIGIWVKHPKEGTEIG
jgi:hypothetical protein